MAPRGIVTAAVGDVRYLEMSVDMALSVREVSDLPVALATDERMARVVGTHYPDVFDHVDLVSERFFYRRALKYGVPEVTPFEEALFVDADAWVISDVEPLFENLSRSDRAVLVHGQIHDRASPAVHHHFRIADLLVRFDRTSYLKCNSGVFAFRRTEAVPAMEELLRRYRDHLVPTLRRGFLGDELSIGVYGVELGLGFFDPPGPMHWQFELADLDLDAAPKPIVHLIKPVRADTFHELVLRSEARRTAAGVRRLGGRHWHWKHGMTRRPRWRNNILAPIEHLFRPPLSVDDS